MITPLLAAAFLAAAPAPSGMPFMPFRPDNPAAPQWAPVDCTISVAFGSYGSGIDRPSLTRIERLLRTDRRVLGFTRHPWGREGEVTLCVSLGLRDVYRVGPEIEALVSARPRGPIQIHYPRRMPAPD